LTPDKNITTALQAAAELSKAGIDNTLDIIGDGPQLESLQNMALNLGIAGQVMFHGNISHSEVLRLLAQSHLFLFPTRTAEGFPKALLEALACGLPAIATAVSVIPQLIAGCGVALREPTPALLAQTILKMIQNPSELAAMAGRARAASQGYTLEAWLTAINRHLTAAWGRLD